MDNFLNVLFGGSERRKNPVLLPETTHDSKNIIDEESGQSIKTMDGTHSEFGVRTIHRRKTSKITGARFDDGDGDYDGGISGSESSGDYADTDDFNSSDFTDSSEDDDISSSDDSFEETYSFAELPLKGLSTSEMISDGTIRIIYNNGNIVYLCPIRSNFGYFLESHREEIRRRCSTKEGGITVIKTKTTPKGIVLDSIRIESNKDRKERAMQMKNFETRNGFMEHVPDFFLKMKMERSSEDETGESDDEDQDVRVVINKKSLFSFRNTLNKEGGDLATIPKILDGIPNKDKDSDIEAVMFGEEEKDEFRVRIAPDISQKEIEEEEEEEEEHSPVVIPRHTHQHEEAKFGEKIPFEEKKHISALEHEAMKEQAKAMILGLLSAEEKYYIASEVEFLLYEKLFDYTGALFPFMTQTKAFCQTLRERRLYGSNALNTYKKFIDRTMVTHKGYVPPEDIEELLKNRKGGEGSEREQHHARVPFISTTMGDTKEETSEESGSSSTTTSTTKQPSVVDKFLSTSTYPSLREQDTKDILEGKKLDEKWKAVAEKCEHIDGIPLTVLTMEAMCSQWTDVSQFSIALVEAYQNLFTIACCIEKEVDAVTQIEDRAKNGGVFMSTEQYRALRNGLACIRSRKKYIITTTFEGRS